MIEASKYNAGLTERIIRLKKQRNAVILAHNYQLGEVQDIADFVGDSLELSRTAAETEADVVVFCGVHFMSEIVSILCPNKISLLPDANSGCPMADMITAERLREEKKHHPEATVVCYVNSSAAVKAESDICCTSSNVIKIVENLDAEEVLFIPDQYLGHYVSTKVRKRIIPYPGFCPIHARIYPQDIIALRQEHPQAKVLIHPECRPEVIALADKVLSTGGMCEFAGKTEAKELIIGTEIGIIYRLRKENNDKKFIPASDQAICPTMKLITLESILKSLEEMTTEVKVPEEIRLKAKAAVDRMLESG